VGPLSNSYNDENSMAMLGWYFLAEILYLNISFTLEEIYASLADIKHLCCHKNTS